MPQKYTIRYIFFICILYGIGITPYRAKPLSSIDQCCTTHTTTKIYLYEKEVTPRTETSPGKGPMVLLYQTPYYKQRIKRKRCVARRGARNSFCKDLCHEMQRYVKQSVIVEDGYYKKLGTRDIWVPDGCRDGV